MYFSCFSCGFPTQYTISWFTCIVNYINIGGQKRIQGKPKMEAIPMNISQLQEEKNQLIEYEFSTRSEATRKNYKSIINRFLTWCNDEHFQEIHNGNYLRIIDKYKTYLIHRHHTYTTRNGTTLQKNKQLSQYTINQYIKKILYFLRQCGIETPKQPKLFRGAYVPEERKFITYTEYQQLIQYATDIRTKVIFELMFKSGLRVHEVVNMTIADYLEAPTTPEGNKKICIIGKGNKKRQIHVPKDVCTLIDEYLGNDHPHNTYLIGSKRKTTKDKPLTTNQIRKIIKNVCVNCDHLENTTYSRKVTPHVLRHSYAVHLIKNNVPLNVVQKLLGHSKIDITSIYTEVDSDTAINEVDGRSIF